MRLNSRFLNFREKKNAKLYVCLLDQEGAHAFSSFHIGNTGLIVPLSLPPCFIIELILISISAEARQTRQITRQLEFQRATTEVIYRPENRDFIFVNSRILNPARMRILPWVPVYLGFKTISSRAIRTFTRLTIRPTIVVVCVVSSLPGIFSAPYS